MHSSKEIVKIVHTFKSYGLPKSTSYVQTRGVLF
jgi:hypothetical protein